MILVDRNDEPLSFQGSHSLLSLHHLAQTLKDTVRTTLAAIPQDTASDKQQELTKEQWIVMQMTWRGMKATMTLEGWIDLMVAMKKTDEVRRLYHYEDRFDDEKPVFLFEPPIVTRAENEYVRDVPEAFDLTS